MKQPRFWLSLIGLCAAVACASAIILAIVSATTALAVTTREQPASVEAKDDTAGRQKVLRGVVSDSSCNAKHMIADRNAAQCTRECVSKGARYTLVAGERVYVLDGNPAEVDPLAGQRAEVVGLLDGNVVTVRSIKIAQ